MDRRRFHALVAAAIEEIPEPFRRHLVNVEVVVEDEPSDELLREMGLNPRRDTIYGLYEGVPIDERALDGGPLLPDRIAIYYRPLVRDFRTPGAIRREIRATIIHEVGHLFGLEDDEIEAEGY
ncbi:metallopeptidase family protein [bacterium]|nr:metallopeptidase family protein [bacterium]